MCIYNGCFKKSGTKVRDDKNMAISALQFLKLIFFPSDGYIDIKNPIHQVGEYKAYQIDVSKIFSLASEKTFR